MEWVLRAVTQATPRGRAYWDLTLECGHHREAARNNWKRTPARWRNGRDPGQWERVEAKPPRKVRCYQCVLASYPSGTFQPRHSSVTVWDSVPPE